MAKLLALDPGDTTGYAIFHYNNDSYSFIESGTIEDGVVGFIEWGKNGYLNMFDTIVSEKFIVRPTFVGDVEALKIEGALLAYGCSPLFQSASMKRSLYYQLRTEKERFDWLRSLGFDGVDHALDAVTHGLLFLRSIRNREVLEMFKIRQGL